MLNSISATEARERINVIISHAWMVRTFLKHAPELEEDVQLLRVPRTIFDFARAVETRYADPDPMSYIKMVRKKLGKLKKASEQFAQEQPEVSDHTNFRQAVLSLRGCVRAIEEVLDAVAADPDAVSHAT